MPYKPCYRFDDFLLDADSGELLREGQRVALTPTAFRVLLALVENQGRTVLAEELRERVWGESIVEDANLDVQLSHVRKALGDSAKAPRYIHLTRPAGTNGQPARGYRLTANITECDNSDPVPAIETVSELPAPRKSFLANQPGLHLRTGLRDLLEGIDSILYALAEACNIILAGLAEGGGKILRGLMKGWLVVALVVLAAWLGWIGWAWESVRARPSVTLGALGLSLAALGVWLWRRWRRLKRCVAVLPFESHYPPNLYEEFSTGLSTAFNHKLGERPHLAQIRESIEANQTDLARVCRSLGVYSALRGVLDWDDNAMRVTLKLIHRDGQTLLWSGQFTTHLTPALTMQETLSTQMAEAFWHYRATA